MTPDQRELLGDLLKALARIERKSQPLLANPSLLDSEAGQDALDVICMQFMAVGTAPRDLPRCFHGMRRRLAGRVSRERLRTVRSGSKAGPWESSTRECATHQS